MSAIGLVDEILALASQVAISPPEHRAVLVAEIDARIAADDVQGPELEMLRAEVRRLADGATS